MKITIQQAGTFGSIKIITKKKDMYFKVTNQNDELLDVFEGDIDSLIQANQEKSDNELIEEVEQTEYKELEKILDKESLSNQQTSVSMQYIPIQYPQDPQTPKDYSDLELKLICLNFYKKKKEKTKISDLQELFEWVKGK